jgi:hypothetical protein
MAAFLLLAVSPTSSQGDEGMWLFNDPPRKLLKTKHDFEPTDAWLAHVQQASVRFNSGGSGSFVSADGLVMTNHHVGADALQKLSTPERDLLAQGFCARTPQEELKCVDLELNVLVNIEDVTERVKTAVKAEMSPAEAEKARRAVMNTIEEESLRQTDLRSDVVTLYRGAIYHLYRYRKYTDVRLVFAPEQSIAFYGGDPDNFEYPRYDLDICFFRVYEEGQPAHVPQYLKWSENGAGEGELVFVSGHPGRTDRQDTVAHLEFLRDRAFPYSLDKIRRREILLLTYSERSLENARRAKDDLFGIQNARKARLGGLAGLQDPSVMNLKRSDEKALRQAVEERPELKRATDSAWGDVADALRQWSPIYFPHDLLEQGGAFNTELFFIARGLVRLTEESTKPNTERLREYRESNLESLKQYLFSAAPIYADLETVKLADSLSMYMELAGAESELVRKVLDGKSPQERAALLVQGTRLADVDVRKRLVEGGVVAIKASDDPMIQLALLVDGPARKVRKAYEEKVEEPMRQAYAKIANVRFAVLGTTTYPDATFTLRLAFGEVKGYQDEGKQLPAWTTIGGAFQDEKSHGAREPFVLPKSWHEHKDSLDLDTPLNFVATPDIIGGNSGSPVINRNAEVVGIIFDGNLPSLVWDFVYTEERGRAIAVDSRGIIESLRKVYHADRVVNELMPSR